MADRDSYGIALLDAMACGRGLEDDCAKGRDGYRRGGWSARSRGCGGWGGSRWRGWLGRVEVFGAGDVKSGSGGAGGGGVKGETYERGHDEGGDWFGVLRGAEQEADLRAVDAFCAGGGGLGEYGAGGGGGLKVRDGAEFEREASDGDGGGALGLADEVGNGDFLGAEAFSDADGPLAADDGTGGR